MRDTPPWRGTLLVFALFFLLYILTASGHFSTPDEELMFRTTEALATRGTLAIEPIVDASGSGFASRKGVSGREYAQYGLGNSLAAVPLYYAGLLASRIVPADLAEHWLAFRTTLLIPPDKPPGPELVKRFVVSFQGSLIGAALCALFWRFAWLVARHPLPGILSPGRAAWLATLALGAGTMVWPHARTFFSEPLATLLILASFYLVAGGRPKPGPGRAFAAGAFFALALLTRLDSFFLLPGLGLFIALRYLETENETGGEGSRHGAYVETADEGLRRLFSISFLKVAGAAAVPLAAAAAFQLTLNAALYGGATELGHADQTEGIRFSTPLLAGLYGFLFSAGKSILLFSPAIVLGMAGWKSLGRRDLSLAVGLGVSSLIALLLHSRWQNWSGGWDWGPRHIYQLHALVLLPAAALFAEGWSRWMRAGYWALMVPAAAVQLYGTSQHAVDFFTLYYRLPLTRPVPRPPMAVALYSPGESVPLATRMGLVDPQTGRLREDTFWPPVAPINDSVYVPQNTVWYRYAEMWERGYTDNVWLRLWLRAEGDEQEIR